MGIEFTKITVVTPTYNEAENLPKLITALFSLNLPDLKVLVVDDNSPDGTGELAEDLGRACAGKVMVLHRPGKLGLGTAYIDGFMRALSDGAQAVVQMDADLSHPPELLPGLLETLRACEMAMGSRYISGGAVDRNWPPWRKALSSFGNIYARAILSLTVRDATGGYRAWRREALLGMPLQRVRSNGYAFQVEMAYIAYRLGYRFREIPFYFADRQWGRSKISLQIQREAAIRVWLMLWEYRNLRPPPRAA
jgi:dolichol-phosphate mannosyltransferase